MDIDYKKLMQQDQEFKNYIIEIFLKLTELQPENIKAIHAMYQADMSVEQVIIMFKLNQ